MSSQPILIRILNKWGRVKLLDVAELMNNARRKSGLENFGKPDVSRPLSVLIQAINEEASLSPLGYQIINSRIQNLLQNRLRAYNLINIHPEINEITIDRPIIIAGFQRTGTSLLQRTLANHADIRSLLTWESLNPAPFRNDRLNKKRKLIAKRSSKALKYLSPDFFSIHSVVFDQPEEEVLLLDMTFQSTVPETLLNVPSYVKWISNQDPKMPYEFLKSMMQMLTWQNSKPRWLLKTPYHLEQLPTLLKTFPDCMIIHTYRDPLKTVPSFCNLIYQSRKLLSSDVSPKQIGQEVLQKTANTIKTAVPYLQNQNVISVSYNSLLNNRSATLQRILRFCDLDVNAFSKDDLQANSENSHIAKYGNHKYNAATFGLSNDMIRKRFNNYEKMFNIPQE